MSESTSARVQKLIAEMKILREDIEANTKTVRAEGEELDRKMKKTTNEEATKLLEEIRKKSEQSKQYCKLRMQEVEELKNEVDTLTDVLFWKAS